MSFFPGKDPEAGNTYQCDAISQVIRATSVVVLPDPAGATHSSGPGGAVAASRWSGASLARRSTTLG